jgi:hypothetical protein
LVLMASFTSSLEKDVKFKQNQNLQSRNSRNVVGVVGGLANSKLKGINVAWLKKKKKDEKEGFS